MLLFYIFLETHFAHENYENKVNNRRVVLEKENKSIIIPFISINFYLIIFKIFKWKILVNFYYYENERKTGKKNLLLL